MSLSGRWGTFSFGEVVLNYQHCCEWKDPMIISITHRYATVWSSALDCVLVTQVRCGVKNIVHIRTTSEPQIQDKSQASELTYDALDIVLKVLLKGASTSRGFHTENITCETEMCFKQTVFCMLCYEFWICYHFCSIIFSFLIIFHRYDCLMDVLRTRFTFCLSYRQKHAKKSSKWL